MLLVVKFSCVVQGQAVAQLAKTVDNVTVFGVCSKSKHEALKANNNNIDHLLERGSDYTSEVRKWVQLYIFFLGSVTWVYLLLRLNRHDGWFDTQHNMFMLKSRICVVDIIPEVHHLTTCFFAGGNVLTNSEIELQKTSSYVFRVSDWFIHQYVS